VSVFTHIFFGLFDASAYLILVRNGLKLIVIDLILSVYPKDRLWAEFFDSHLPGRHDWRVAQRSPKSAENPQKKSIRS
jgi:hypothetical protein